MNQKSTPKSCSCGTCKRGKSSKAGKEMMKLHERAFRHNQKVKLEKVSEADPAPVGNYFD